MSSDTQQTAHKQSFFVKGMTCVTCVKHVERAIKKVDGISFVSVNLATESGFALSNQEIPFDELKKAVAALKNAGYRTADIGVYLLP